MVREFSINERFSLLNDMASMVVVGATPSLIVTGEGGLGKTHAIKQTIAEFGLSEGDYVFYKGYSTARGLYETLYDNSDKLIVFDDCDSVLEDKTAVNILKSALDSYDEREISWMSKAKGDAYPNKFKFEGRIIFISNKAKSSIDNAVLTRSLTVDLGMSPEDKIERMQAILENVLPDYSDKVKQDALNFLDSVKDKVSINMRMLIMVTKMVVNFPDRWESMATYMISNAA